MVTLARQTLRLEQHLEQLAFQEVPTRLAQTLIELAEDNDGEVPSPLTHEEIANLVGITRETVSKQLGLFEQDGLIEMGYRRVAIVDSEGLRDERARQYALGPEELTWHHNLVERSTCLPGPLVEIRRSAPLA
jgi:DNA-binding MarR family transcriptional regulator